MTSSVFGELSDEDLEQAYAEAVCRRADLTGTRAHDERINGTLSACWPPSLHTHPALPLLMALVDGTATPAPRDTSRRRPAGTAPGSSDLRTAR